MSLATLAWLLMAADTSGAAARTPVPIPNVVTWVVVVIALWLCFDVVAAWYSGRPYASYLQDRGRLREAELENLHHVMTGKDLDRDLAMADALDQQWLHPAQCSFCHERHPDPNDELVVHRQKQRRWKSGGAWHTETRRWTETYPRCHACHRAHRWENLIIAASMVAGVMLGGVVGGFSGFRVEGVIISGRFLTRRRSAATPEQQLMEIRLSLRRTLNATAAASQPAPPSTKESKPCPTCGQPVTTYAIKCRHCKADIG
ncbi:MAG: hypothetical protein HYV60_06145 [Planctomycetia bacterium]|nr:hypothetical protein [Planctomycetia bacterium]